MIRKVATGVVVLGAAYFLVLGGDYTFLDLWRLDREQDREAEALEAARQEVQLLEARADSLASDSAMLERLAREQFGLIKEGERLYRFAEPDSTDRDAGEVADSARAARDTSATR